MDRSIALGACAVIALLVRVGLGLYLAGLSRSKNSAGAVLRSVCDLCVATLAFWAVGAAVLFQTHNPFLGFELDLALGGTGQGAIVWRVLFFATVALIATGPVVGAVGERSRFFSTCGASVLLAGVVVPIAGNWVIQQPTQGWLQRIGFVDVAGASWLHVTAGVCAAAAAWAVGPRAGKYHRDGSASVIPGHSVPLVAVGVVLMLVGWIGYVAGCQAWASARFEYMDRAALNVLLAGAAGGLASLVLGQSRYGKPDVLLTLTGLLGAMVAITGGAGRVAPLSAVVIGAVAGVLVPLAAIWIDLILRIDDPAASVAIHAVGGAWGTLAAGIFMPGTFVERLKQTGIQALGLLSVAALGGVCSFALFAVMRSAGALRAKQADEFDGLDLAEHDIGAYPDFQQNTIRSFHLREA
jgi:Amt family ammonium transporter